MNLKINRNNVSPIFLGALPIFKFENEYEPSDEEIKYIKSLDYISQKDFQPLKISKNKNIIKDNSLVNIKNAIDKAFDFYVENILQVKNQFYVTQSWSTINRKGSFHSWHTHPNTLFSCVFYADARNSELYFRLKKSPIQSAFNFNYNIKQYNIHNSSGWDLPVKTGDIVIFPGDLEHSAKINADDYERVIIGVNYFIRGELGIENDVDRIEI